MRCWCVRTVGGSDLLPSCGNACDTLSSRDRAEATQRPRGGSTVCFTSDETRMPLSSPATLSELRHRQAAEQGSCALADEDGQRSRLHQYCKVLSLFEALFCLSMASHGAYRKTQETAARACGVCGRSHTWGVRVRKLSGAFWEQRLR